MQIGPIGSREDTLIAFLTDDGVYLRTGCFWGTIKKFRSNLAETHKQNEHEKEYLAALELVVIHAKLWTPKQETKE